MLDIDTHDVLMNRILRDVYRHPQLQTQLVFKGGTCLYYFHDLPRFSTDLDFSLHSEASVEDVPREEITDIMQNRTTITDDEDKRFTWLWMGSFAENKQRIKVEVLKRRFDDRYEMHEFFGLTVRSLDLASMFAHKLCAITDRKEVVNRDLYDTWWLLTRNAPIRHEIVVQRTGMAVGAYLHMLTDFLEREVEKKHILNGLGEVLSRSQKDWVRDHLYTELLAEIQLRRKQTHFWPDYKAAISAGADEAEAFEAGKRQELFMHGLLHAMENEAAKEHAS